MCKRCACRDQVLTLEHICRGCLQRNRPHARVENCLRSSPVCQGVCSRWADDLYRRRDTSPRRNYCLERKRSRRRCGDASGRIKRKLTEQLGLCCGRCADHGRVRADPNCACSDHNGISISQCCDICTCSDDTIVRASRDQIASHISDASIVCATGNKSCASISHACVVCACAWTT